MIAGVWSRSGASNAETILGRMGAAVPSAMIRGENFAIGAWSSAPEGRLDAERQLAWVGTLRLPSEQLHVQNAAGSAGDYALIGGGPEGLLVARGRHAGRCVYFAALSGGDVAACSRLEPLVRCLSAPLPWVPTLGSLILARWPEDLSATVFKQVQRVQASEAIVLGAAGIAECAHAKLRVTPAEGSQEQISEHLQTLIERAVQRSIQGKGRVAILVSGGLDSSCVLAHAVAVARGASRAEVDAVTLSFASSGDDRGYLNELCDALGIVPLRVAPAEAADHVVPSLVADAAPVSWPTAGWNMALRERARSRGAELVLAGTGGDQIFDGDPRVLSRRVWSRHFGERLLQAANVQRRAGNTSIFRLVKLLLGPYVWPTIPRIQNTRLRRAAARRWSWAGPRLRQIMDDCCVRESSSQEWTAPTGELRFTRLIRRGFLQLAESRGQMEAASGVARVDPLMDDEVVSFVAGLPQHLLFAGDRRRGLFRQAMRGLVPERLRLRPDKARFEPAIAEMVKARPQTLEPLRDLAKMTLLADLGLVDPRGYKRQFETVLEEGARSAEWLTVWPALAIEAFVRQHWGTHQEREP